MAFLLKSVSEYTTKSINQSFTFIQMSNMKIKLERPSINRYPR